LILEKEVHSFDHSRWISQQMQSSMVESQPPSQVLRLKRGKTKEKIDKKRVTGLDRGNRE